MSSRKFKRSILGGLVALAVAGVPLTASAESLGDALASAYRNSGLLDQNRATLRATDEGVATALGDLRPSIGYTGQISRSDSRVPGVGTIQGEWTKQLTFNATMELYTFGRNKLAVDVAKEAVLATRETLLNIEQQVLSSAVAAYMSVREAQALVNLRDNAVRLNVQNLRASRDRFEVGEITRTQVSQVEAQLANARAQLASAQGELSSARETYKVAIGNYPGTLSSPPSVRLPAKSVDEAVSIARSNHPAIKTLQHRAAAADLAVEIAERSMLPTIEGSARVTFVDDLGTQDRNVGVTASGPIYQGGKIASAVRKAIAERDSSRAALLQAAREVEQSVRSNWALLNVYGAAEQASQTYVQAQRVALNGVREETDLGASTTLDVLDAEQDLLDAQVSAIQAQIAREAQYFFVLQSVGALTASNLKLNVPIYDPAAYYNAVKDGPTSYVSPEGEKLDRVLKSLGRN
ncbi:TolC family outer membrane protein [Celeribacter arenosi]|uniref:TolC family outer membrane protein n=1 Tax=Celeribacter arenosi TaxID=792649 RepID=A0ABP7KAT5_9RHOB